ncbi:collagen alpha-2(IX) chain-like [Gigantopelta aegis]|uniref:collagen alpha-2(IX) chain-like n=1 Tax=Gigantopelta aegis TaxID=1735272 RepID=UPI001B88788D|nr:collagen alpha-2(IX) chain-like [Gigantopelta aegis]
MKGPKGMKGPDGGKGSLGAPGSSGPAGVTGDKGLTGLQGSQGDPGPRGPQGTAGEAGSAGHLGAKGARGDPGMKGAMGARGKQATVHVVGNPERNVSAFPGDHLTLNCTTSPYPPSLITWFHDGQALSSGPDVTVKGAIVDLNITGTTHSGTYLCKAGKESIVYHVTVIGKVNEIYVDKISE